MKYLKSGSKVIWCIQITREFSGFINWNRSNHTNWRRSTTIGLDRQRPQILKDLLNVRNEEASNQISIAITTLKKIILSGDVPASVCPYLYGAMLSVLQKICSAIRPIAVNKKDVTRKEGFGLFRLALQQLKIISRIMSKSVTRKGKRYIFLKLAIFTWHPFSMTPHMETNYSVLKLELIQNVFILITNINVFEHF